MEHQAVCGRIGFAVILSLWSTIGRGLAEGSEAGLRSLLLNDHNQELIENLGTGYEIVHPYQVRKNWEVQGLSTRISTVDGTPVHTQQTTLLIETLDHKLTLDLELNTKLFAPTLVQLLYLKSPSHEESPIVVNKLPENCYYHATVREHPNAKAAFQTCEGIRGAIYLGKKIYFIHPLHGNHSGRHPHLLYHHSPREEFKCGGYNVDNPDQEDSRTSNTGKDYEFSRRRYVEIALVDPTLKDEFLRHKYIEIALVLDQTLFEKYKSPPSEAMAAAVEIINYVDLLYRPLNTSVSLVYVELWVSNQMHVEQASDTSEALAEFRNYAVRRISRISVDATHLLTGAELQNEESGIAFLDSICTNNAVGITQVNNIFEPHLTSFVLAHMIGHNLGMAHETSDCECPKENGCVMKNQMQILSSTTFSSCSVHDYQRTLSKGYGACLFNMPTMRMSICGNSILEEPEQCDCGTAEECAKSNPCCDPMTCRLIKHAECSAGPCCRKCKLLSPDYLCRPSKGECDIPEFCDGKKGECPEDLFKRNGAICSGGNGYCFHGDCPVLQHQCTEVWGQDAESADGVCFERLNVQGTPNGNCGTDRHGQIAKCTTQNSYCGFLQCSNGEKIPVSLDNPPIHFVVHKINHEGTVYECKARTYPNTDFKEGLVKDGTKCGYQKLCLNQTCTSLRSLVSGKCPLEDMHQTCSEHGICTNINTCFCDEGWKGPDCSVVDEEAKGSKTSEEYYDSIGGNDKAYSDQEEMKLNPNLAITVIAASIVIGVGLVVIVVLIFFYKHK